MVIDGRREEKRCLGAGIGAIMPVIWESAGRNDVRPFCDIAQRKVAENTANWNPSHSVFPSRSFYFFGNLYFYFKGEIGRERERKSERERERERKSEREGERVEVV